MTANYERRSSDLPAGAVSEYPVEWGVGKL